MAKPNEQRVRRPLATRRHSKLVVEALVKALGPFDGLTNQERDEVVRLYRARQQRQLAVVDHIASMGLYGVSDQAIEALLAALELARRERERPQDFASSGVNGALQGERPGGKRRGESDRYNHDEIRKRASELDYWSAPKGSKRRGEIVDKIISHQRLKRPGGSNMESLRKGVRRILSKPPATT